MTAAMASGLIVPGRHIRRPRRDPLPIRPLQRVRALSNGGAEALNAPITRAKGPQRRRLIATLEFARGGQCPIHRNNRL